MRPSPWLLIGAAVVLSVGAWATLALVDLSSHATRNSLGISVGAAAGAVSVTFLLTYLLQSVLARNNLLLAMGLSKDLSHLDFRRIHLRHISLRGRRLVGANLARARLAGIDLAGCDLRGADLRGANLRGADLRGADLRGANLRGAQMRDVQMWEARISGADFRNARMRHAEMICVQGQRLTEAEVEELYALGVRVHGVYSVKGVLNPKTDYSASWFQKADLLDANLSGADLRGATMKKANLAYADLSASRRGHTSKPMATPKIRGQYGDIFLNVATERFNKLAQQGADLRDADLDEVDLRGSNLDGTILSFPLDTRQTQHSVGSVLIESGPAF